MINREFREGDRVTCALFGKGIIESVSVKFIDVKYVLSTNFYKISNSRCKVLYKI